MKANAENQTAMLPHNRLEAFFITGLRAIEGTSHG
jgi:hypothetical protein